MLELDQAEATKVNLIDTLVEFVQSYRNYCNDMPMVAVITMAEHFVDRLGILTSDHRDDITAVNLCIIHIPRPQKPETITEMIRRYLKGQIQEKGPVNNQSLAGLLLF